MQKIPTLFIRIFENHNVVGITENVTPGCEEILNGAGIATIKFDGSCCAILDGKFYRRYDAKKNRSGIRKQPPEGAIPCGDPDPVTGHWPHWVEVSKANPGDKWFLSAYQNSNGKTLPEGTYEAIGPHFQTNPYHLDSDCLIRHGSETIELPDRSFAGIRSYLNEHEIEGIVFWQNGNPVCKIKRTDFGFAWPVNRNEKYIETERYIL